MPKILTAAIACLVLLAVLIQPTTLRLTDDTGATDAELSAAGLLTPADFDAIEQYTYAELLGYRMVASMVMIDGASVWGQAVVDWAYLTAGEIDYWLMMLEQE